jgi:hypothetical protein
LVTVIVQLALASATPGDSFDQHGLINLSIRAAPSYLDDHARPFHSAIRYTPSDDGRSRKLLLLSPAFGVDEIVFQYQRDDASANESWTRDTHGLVPPYVAIMRRRFGWPFHSTYFDMIATSSSSDRVLLQEYWTVTNKIAGLRRGIKTPPWWPRAQGVYDIPIVLRVSGFTANSMFYACLYLAPGVLARAVRTRHRRRRGKCLTCGYEMRDLHLCPECGIET